MTRCLPSFVLALSCITAPALTCAQIIFQRTLPADSLRGEIVFGSAPPAVTLNGVATRTAPGTKIRGRDNMMVMSAPLAGQTYVVNYTKDLLGQPKDIWLLRPEEIERSPWPTTPEEARSWTFNTTTQTWTKP